MTGIQDVTFIANSGTVGQMSVVRQQNSCYVHVSVSLYWLELTCVLAALNKGKMLRIW